MVRQCSIFSNGISFVYFVDFIFCRFINKTFVQSLKFGKTMKYAFLDFSVMYLRIMVGISIDS